MRTRQRAFAILGVLSILAAAPAAAEPRNLTVTPEAAPVAFESLREPLLSNVGSDLAIETRVINRSARPVQRVEVKALVLSARGQVKGFHTFMAELPLAPGEARYFVYRTSAVQLTPGDQVIALPIAVRGRDLDWRIARDASAALTRTLEGATGSETLERVHAADDKPGEQGIEPPPQNFCNECSTRNDACRTDCRCGIQSFSCSCSNDSASSSCSCFQCPAG